MPGKKLLLVVDMQNDFIDGPLGTPEARSIVPKVCDKIAGWDGTVWFTLDTHGEDYLSTQEGRRLPIRHCIADLDHWDLDRCCKGTDGWCLNRDVREAALSRKYDFDLRLIPKETFGAKNMLYGKDGIYEAYTFDGLTSIELVGLCTDICVISNAVLIKSFFPEIEISVDASCCAGVTPQSHKNALEAMKMLQIEIKNEEA